MDPVQNQLDGGRTEIIRALGKMKYTPAGKPLLDMLRTMTDVDEMLQVVEALEQMGDRRYVPVLGRRLQTPFRPGVYKIVWWAEEHRIPELRRPLERALIANPRADGGDYDVSRMGFIVRALGTVGDAGTGRLLHKRLEALLKRDRSEEGLADEVGDLIDALAGLRHTPARVAVDRALFVWSGASTQAGRWQDVRDAPPFLSEVCRYIRACPRPGDAEFLRGLIRSGVAMRWRMGYTVQYTLEGVDRRWLVRRWQGRVGTQVTVVGAPMFVELGAFVGTPDGMLWVKGLKEWPKGIRNDYVRVTGVLETHYDLPVFIAGESAPDRFAIAVPRDMDPVEARTRYVLANPKWRVVSPPTPDTKKNPQEVGGHGP